MTDVKSNIPAKNVPNAGKWTVTAIRSGPVGSVLFVFSILDMAGNVLEQIPLTQPLGEFLHKLQPGAIVNKIFGCGTEKKLAKET